MKLLEVITEESTGRKYPNDFIIGPSARIIPGKPITISQSAFIYEEKISINLSCVYRYKIDERMPAREISINKLAWLMYEDIEKEAINALEAVYAGDAASSLRSINNILSLCKPEKS